MGIQILAPSHTCLVTLERTLHKDVTYLTISFTWEVTYLLWAGFPQLKDCHEGSTSKSKCGLQTNSIFIAWKLKTQTFRFHPCPTESEFLTRFPGGSCACECEKQCLRMVSWWPGSPWGTWCGLDMDGGSSRFILISQVTTLLLMLVFYSFHDSSLHRGDVFAEGRVFTDVIKNFEVSLTC